MLQEDLGEGEIKHADCQCLICTRSQHKLPVSLPSDLGLPNHMEQFIKVLPVNFPLIVEQTVIINKKADFGSDYHSYTSASKDDKNKWTILHQQLKGISSISSQNVQIYFKTSEKLMPKFEAMTLLQNKSHQIIYIQPYQHRPIIQIQYPSDICKKMDSILVEHLEKKEEIQKGEYKMNEQFLDFVYREYGEEVFYYFLTDLYARLFKLATQCQIQHGFFYWTSESLKSQIISLQSKKKSGQGEKYNSMQALGRPRSLTFKPKLVNVKDLQILKYEKLYSFEEQYQQLIKERIATTTKKTISAIKNKVYRHRLQNFRNKLHGIYDKQQQSIIKQIQQQKQFEFQVDSEKMARLLIPNMGPYKNLRQILNSESAFRSVFLNKRKDKSSTVLPQLNNSLTPKFSRKKSSRQFLQKSPGNISVYTKKKYQKILTTPSTHQ